MTTATKSRPKKSNDSKSDKSNENESVTNGADTPGKPATTTAAVPEQPDDPLAKLTRMEARHQRILKANQRLHKFQNKVMQSTQAYKAAQGQLKSDIGDRDKAALELQRIIDDVRNGQDPLPGMDVEDEPSTPATSGQPVQQPAQPGEKHPIATLGTSELTKLVGADAVEQAKLADDPIGLSDKQLEKLEAAEFSTVEELEDKMRADSWWWKKVANDGHAVVVQRVISSLLAFRRAVPQIQAGEKADTVGDKAAGQDVSKKPEETVTTSA